MKKLLTVLLVFCVLFACTAGMAESPVFTWKGNEMTYAFMTADMTAYGLADYQDFVFIVRLQPVAETFPYADFSQTLFTVTTAAGDSRIVAFFIIPNTEKRGMISDWPSDNQEYIDMLFKMEGLTEDDLQTAVLSAYEEKDGEPVYAVALGDLPPFSDAKEESKAPETGAAVPAEAVGTWKGIGTPKNNGTPIDLTLIINEDGTGEYTFDQGSYHENAPFTLSNDASSFSVSGLTGGVEGTWKLVDGIMKLDITATLPTGSTYSYTAELQRQ